MQWDHGIWFYVRRVIGVRDHWSRKGHREVSTTIRRPRSRSAYPFYRSKETLATWRGIEGEGEKSRRHCSYSQRFISVSTASQMRYRHRKNDLPLSIGKKSDINRFNFSILEFPSTSRFSSLIYIEKIMDMNRKRMHERAREMWRRGWWGGREKRSVTERFIESKLQSAV